MKYSLRDDKVFQETLDCMYRFIQSYIQSYGFGPSLREIGEGCHLSKSIVGRYLDRLEMQGRITREPGLPRSIHVLPEKRNIL